MESEFLQKQFRNRLDNLTSEQRKIYDDLVIQHAKNNPGKPLSSDRKGSFLTVAEGSGPQTVETGRYYQVDTIKMRLRFEEAGQPKKGIVDD